MPEREGVTRGGPPSANSPTASIESSSKVSSFRTRARWNSASPPSGGPNHQDEDGEYRSCTHNCPDNRVEVERLAPHRERQGDRRSASQHDQRQQDRCPERERHDHPEEEDAERERDRLRHGRQAQRPGDQRAGDEQTERGRRQPEREPEPLGRKQARDRQQRDRREHERDPGQRVDSSQSASRGPPATQSRRVPIHRSPLAAKDEQPGDASLPMIRCRAREAAGTQSVYQPPETASALAPARGTWVPGQGTVRGAAEVDELRVGREDHGPAGRVHRPVAEVYLLAEHEVALVKKPCMASTASRRASRTAARLRIPVEGLAVMNANPAP